MILLLPSEKEGMLLRLEENKIPIKVIKMNSDKKKVITPSIQALVSKIRDLKTLKIKHIYNTFDS